jgi:hypothetical protein
MLTPISKPADGLVESWDLAKWNQALFVHFFVSLQIPSRCISRLYITGDELQSASGITTSSANEVRTCFINTLRKTIGTRSLGHDAEIRGRRWVVDSDQVPPFLSHLLLTCMVANDLADEVKSIGDFRKRLTKILKGGVHHGLPRLRPLWEEFSAWLALRNTRDPRIATLKLPSIPKSGHHSIIGYPLRLSVPSRRDQKLLTDLLRSNQLLGIEPPVQEVIALVQSRSTKFSLAFREVFREFIEGLKKVSRTALSHTTFWLAIHEIAQGTSLLQASTSSTLKTRVEMEDDDGDFWLYITCDRAEKLNGYHCIPLPAVRTSPFQYALRSDTGTGSSFPHQLFLNGTSPRAIEIFLRPLKAAIADGIVLFVEDEDNVYTFTPTIPASGRLCALVSDKLSAQLKSAISARRINVEITKSAYKGWSEWREFTAEDLQEADFSRLSLLSKVSSLKQTLPVPQIHIRGGIRAGDSYVSLVGSLPRIEIPDAERVTLLLHDGSKIELEMSRSGMGGWDFPEAIDHLLLIGQHRLIAYLASVQLAEKSISFVQDVFGTRYKRPSTDGRWFVESGTQDSAVFKTDDLLVPWKSTEEIFTVDQEILNHRGFGNSEQLQAAVTRLTALLASQRGISERELVFVLKDILNIPWPAVWPTLRAWVENAMLDCLVDLRWRARLYFGRQPTLVAYRNGNGVSAVLTGLVPPFLRQRFSELVSSLGIREIERFSSSPSVPTLLCCHAKSSDQLIRLTTELELPALNWLCKPDALASSVAHIMHASVPEPINWPMYKQWDWQRLTFMANPTDPKQHDLSLHWCRRDDGPDCYKIYQGTSVIWWTRSRTWAILGALKLAGIPAAHRTAPGEISFSTDGAYLPLPLARFTAVVGPTAPGPMFGDGTATKYRYVFPTDRLADVVLDTLYPSITPPSSCVPKRVKRLLAACAATQGPSIPMPVSLSRLLDQFPDPPGQTLPRRVPLSLLPLFFAELTASVRRTD